MISEKYMQDWKLEEHPARFLKGLFHGVATHIRSGYGVVARHLLGRFVFLGLDFIHSCYYGIQPGGMVLINGVPSVPCEPHLGRFGEGSYIGHLKAFKRNLGFLMSDFWAFPWFPKQKVWNVLYSPMDHEDYFERERQLLREYQTVVPFLPFQKKELDKYGIKSENCIGHGVDEKAFFPVEKEKAREITRTPKDKFIIGITAANSDKETRKGWEQAFEAIQIAAQECPDFGKEVAVMVHTNWEDPRGIDLRLLAIKRGIYPVCTFEEPYLSTIGLPDEEMNLVYNSLDVLLNPARREGWGLCIGEALATGTSVIGTRFSSMPDLLGENEERGWLAKVAMKVDTPIMGTTSIPDAQDVARCLLECYLKPDERKRKGENGIEFMKQYTWDRLVMEQWIPLLDNIAIQISQPSVRETRIRRIQI